MNEILYGWYDGIINIASWKIIKEASRDKYLERDNDDFFIIFLLGEMLIFGVIKCSPQVSND